MNWSAIDALIQNKSMLQHPFYQAWSQGKLTIDDLKYYAGQYYALESHFPRLLSRIHASCDNPVVRQNILENLIEEERGPQNHRELWLSFGEGLGLTREEIIHAPRNAHTQACVNDLMELAASDNPATGLAALYAYESQLPEISKSKIDGLRRFYGIENKQALRFFEVHKEVDIWHAQQEKESIEQLGATFDEVQPAVEKACSALLSFLDGVGPTTCMN